MSIQDIVSNGGITLFILLTLVQIAPIKLNPWSWIAKYIGRAINGEVIAKVNNLQTDLANFKGECDKREAIMCRTRIIRFNDELLQGIHHTKEHFDAILIDVDSYDEYCHAHENFRNSIATLATQNIKNRYAKCTEDNSFL